MSTNTDDLSRDPRPDQAEDNAFFPSPYSLTQYTRPKTDFGGVGARRCLHRGPMEGADDRNRRTLHAV